MKTKIISIVLLLVLIAATFTGCAYNYQKKDLGEFATFNNTGFKAAIDALQIEDEEFSSDETTRQSLIAEEIQTKLASALASKAENKKTSGTMSDRAVVTYCFYNEVTVGTDTYYFNMAKMNASSTSSIVLTDNETDLDNKIRAAFRGQDLTDKNYLTKKSGTVEATEKYAIVTYTLDENKDGSISTYTVTNQLVAVAGSSDVFATALVGKTVGTKFATGTDEDAVIVDDAVANDTKTYKNVTVNYTITSGTEFTVTDVKPYTENATVTDIYGVTRNVDENSTVTFHLFAIDFTEVPDYAAMTDDEAAAAVIFDILGKNIKANAICVFGEDEYKYTDADGKEVTLETVIANLAKKYEALDAAQKAYDGAAEEDKAEKQTALDEAKAALDRDTVMAEIKQCNAEMTKLIREGYAEDMYEEAESAYKNKIQEKIVAAVWKKVQANITVASAPKSAVKKAYKNNVASYKYEYYTGSSDSVANTDKYATFDAYLEKVASSIKGSTVTGKAAVKEVLMGEAEDQIKEVLQVYVLAKAVNEIFALTGTDDELKVTGSDVENYAAYMAQIQYYYTGSSVSTEAIKEMYGEENIKAYILFDRTMSFLTDVEAADDAATDKTVKFKHVAYTFQ
ncbi:MAG: hypothetical protein MJ082_03685 [Clostridia bacterium]|nr:hypothetical protein [Clostridia bacterium]